MQINSVSRETLIDAMNHPAGYESMVVRVSGFSAYYTALGRDVQEDILKRTEQSEVVRANGLRRWDSAAFRRARGNGKRAEYGSAPPGDRRKCVLSCAKRAVRAGSSGERKRRCAHGFADEAVSRRDCGSGGSGASVRAGLLSGNTPPGDRRVGNMVFLAGRGQWLAQFAALAMKRRFAEAAIDPRFALLLKRRKPYRALTVPGQ